MENNSKNKIRNLTSYSKSRYEAIKNPYGIKLNSLDTTPNANNLAQETLNKNKRIIHSSVSKYSTTRTPCEILSKITNSKSFYKNKRRSRNVLKNSSYSLNRNRPFTRDTNESNKTIKEFNNLKNMLETTFLENEKLKRLSKEIMLDKAQNREMASTVHSFYQNVIMVDNMHNVNELKAKIEELRNTIAKLTIENNKLKRCALMTDPSLRCQKSFIPFSVLSAGGKVARICLGLS